VTTEEYAEQVRALVRSVKAARDMYEDDYRLRGAYDDLADGAAERCLTVGRVYEHSPSVQGFERADALQSVIECRKEALDIPAYLTQIAHHLGADTDPDVRAGIEHAAMLLVILDRLAERIGDRG